MSIPKKILKMIIPRSTQLNLQLRRSKLASRFSGHPSKRLTIIGVIGSYGKTTTAHLIHRILLESGYRVGLISSINYIIDVKTTKNNVPINNIDPFALQSKLKEMVKSNCRFAVIELSAQAIVEYKMLGIEFDTIVHTNIYQEKTEGFASINEFKQAYSTVITPKTKLIINADDSSAPFFMELISNGIQTYGIDQKTVYAARKILSGPTGLSFTAVGPFGQYTINLGFPGKFNAYNTLAAIATGFSYSVSPERITEALSNTEGIAGRMESINHGQNFNVIIDYARAPESLEMVYESAAKSTHGRLISVIGISGNKPPESRPVVGDLVARYADHVILTSEDPHDSNPNEIIDGMATGVAVADRPHFYRPNTPFKSFKITSGTGENEWWWRIPDRHSAIEKAITLAVRWDTIVITGKGDDEYMVQNGKYIPWSDRKTVENLLERYINPKTSSRQKVISPKHV